MEKPQTPVAFYATEVAPRAKPSNAPAPFVPLLQGRVKRVLGEKFGLTNFGVNFTRLEPGARSAFRHAHTRQDEFVYILEGRPTLVTDSGPMQLAPGMCAGFRAGTGNAHCLINETQEAVVYLEVGDRSNGDEATYPEEDLRAEYSAGSWRYFHKDGTPW
jgi:uncharacterized cupin superfamily protein